MAFVVGVCGRRAKVQDWLVMLREGEVEEGAEC